MKDPVLSANLQEQMKTRHANVSTALRSLTVDKGLDQYPDIKVKVEFGGQIYDFDINNETQLSKKNIAELEQYLLKLPSKRSFWGSIVAMASISVDEAINRQKTLKAQLWTNIVQMDYTDRIDLKNKNNNIKKTADKISEPPKLTKDLIESQIFIHPDYKKLSSEIIQLRKAASIAQVVHSALENIHYTIQLLCKEDDKIAILKQRLG